MNWILHIGTQKTGSKVIQNYLAKNDSFTDLSVKIFFPFQGREGVWHQPIYQELINEKTIKLEKAFQEGLLSGADLGVLSCEVFYLLAKAKISLVRQVVRSAKIIIFIRRQDQLVNSMYNQLIKAHRVNFEYIEKFESNIEAYNPDFDHKDTVTRWGEVFGVENILPIVYDKNASSLERFLRQIGVNNIPSQIIARGQNPNPALNLEGLRILRLSKKLNRIDENLPHLVNVAHRVLQDRFVDTFIKGDQYLLTLKQRNTILKGYSTSNEALRKMYFPKNTNLFPLLEKNALDEKKIMDEIINFESSSDIEIVKTIFREANIPIP